MKPDHTMFTPVRNNDKNEFDIVNVSEIFDPESETMLSALIDQIREICTSPEIYYHHLGDFVAQLMYDDEPTTPSDARQREYVCLVALLELTLLTDWFPAHDTCLNGLFILNDMHQFSDKNNYESGFDLICHEITQGERYEQINDPSNQFRIKRRYAWRDTDLRRRDGLCPAHYGGLKDDEDITVRFYHTFRSLPTSTKQKSVSFLDKRLRYLAHNPSVYRRIIETFIRDLSGNNPEYDETS